MATKDISRERMKIAKLKEELADAHKDIIKAGALFSSIGEGILVADEYGRIEQVNDLTLDILGFTKGELLGKSFIKVIKAVNEDGSEILPMERPITRAFLTGAPIAEHTYYLTKNGTPIPVDITVSPVMFGGEPTGAIEVFRDLTDEYVKEKIQSEFISIASHQLRTPLSSVNTYAQMLSQGYAGKLTSRQTNFVNVIENSANRMNELIHTLLNVTRVEAGNISVNVRTVDVDVTCREIIRALKPLASDKEIAIGYSNNSTATVETDPILLREVISNLLSNAIKYTPPGGRIELKVESREHVVFSVTDNGYGIPERARAYVFSKFYRAANAVANDVSGTGIGLYLAKQIAERLDGDIWFKSELDKGSTFFFSLPLLGSAKKQGRFTLEIPS